MTQGFRFCSFVLSFLKQKYNLELVTEPTQTQQSSGETLSRSPPRGRPAWLRAPGPGQSRDRDGRP